jgi:hypothetical protein
LHFEKNEPALRRGNYVAAITAPTGILAFTRAYGSDTDLVIINTRNETFTDFTVNTTGSNIGPGYKLFTDLLNGTGAYVGTLDASFNLGAFSIGPYGALVYRLESSTGVAPGLEDLTPSIFPNPATDIVTIRMNKEINHPVSVLLHDVAGNIIRNEQKNPGGCIDH